jgi:transposase
MSKMNKYSGAEKLAILHELETGQTTITDILEKYDINEGTFYTWRLRYQLYGYEGLEITCLRI